MFDWSIHNIYTEVHWRDSIHSCIGETRHDVHSPNNSQGPRNHHFPISSPAQISHWQFSLLPLTSNNTGSQQALFQFLDIKEQYIRSIDFYLFAFKFIDFYCDLYYFLFLLAFPPSFLRWKLGLQTETFLFSNVSIQDYKFLSWLYFTYIPQILVILYFHFHSGQYIFQILRDFLFDPWIVQKCVVRFLNF